jgi:hypothetical protein
MNPKKKKNSKTQNREEQIDDGDNIDSEDNFDS